MESLPENNMIEQLRNRLKNYAEDPPADTWDTIAPALPKPLTNSWRRPTITTFLFLTYSTLIWFAGKYSAADEDSTRQNTVGNNTAAVTADSCSADGNKYDRATERLQDFARPLDRQAATNREALVTSHVVEGDSSVDVKNAFGSDLQALRGTINRDQPVSQPDSLVNVSADSVVDPIPVAPAAVIIEKATRNHPKPVLYFQISPTMSYQKVVPFQNDDVLITRLNSRSIFSGDRTGVSFDAGMQWKLSEKLEMYSALSFHRESVSISYLYKSSTLQAVDNNAAQFDYMLAPALGSGAVRYTMNDVGVSGGFLYLLKNTGLRHKIGGGVQYLVDFSQRHGNKNSESMYLNYQILYRLEFPLRPRYTLFVQPAFTHSFFVKEDLRQPFDIRHYNAGLGFGMVYEF
jgi:hypothetical protein